MCAWECERRLNLCRVSFTLVLVVVFLKYCYKNLLTSTFPTCGGEGAVFWSTEMFVLLCELVVTCTLSCPVPLLLVEGSPAVSSLLRLLPWAGNLCLLPRGVPLVAILSSLPLVLLWLRLIPDMLSLLPRLTSGYPELSSLSVRSRPSFKMLPSLKISTSGPFMSPSSSPLSRVFVFFLLAWSFLNLLIFLQSFNSSKKGRMRKKTKLNRNSLVLFRGLVTSLLWKTKVKYL